MIVIGVDPGTGGALAAYDQASGMLDVSDIPHRMIPVGRTKRKRIDVVDLRDYMEMWKLMGCGLVMLEAPGPRPQQTQAAGFQLGYACGMIHMAASAARIPVTTVDPREWKKSMRLPGKVGRLTKDERDTTVGDELKALKKSRNDANANAIIARADELFPSHSHLFRGKMGGYKLDRAEAAVLAKYGALVEINGAGFGDANFEGV